MATENTLNICLGHMPFPLAFRQYVDILLTPKFFVYPRQTILVDDNSQGKFGHTLSEYCQLIWLYDNYEIILEKYDYVRIFQYRRFVSPDMAGENCSLPWATRITSKQLGDFESSFSRRCENELFNQIYDLKETVYEQYSHAHIEEDMINFVNYLNMISIFSQSDTDKFMNDTIMIPACNMGVFHRQTLFWLLSQLKSASSFIHSKYFKERSGYQRRVMGFLLERLNSYLLIHKNPFHQRSINYGHHIIISDIHDIYRTENIN